MCKLRIKEIEFYERDVSLRLPFRFGVITLTEAPQLFVRLKLALESGEEEWGMAAEVLAPKWFDKNTSLSNEDNYEQLRTSVRLASDLYTSESKFQTPFSLFAAHYGSQLEECSKHDLNPLIASYGPALLDRAVLDALSRAKGISFYEAVQKNVVGLKTLDLTPELSELNFDDFAGSLRPADQIHARHTVGLADPLTADDQGDGKRLDDGLPETLEEVISQYGQRYFKLKLWGDLQKDLDRLSLIAALLDTIPDPYFVTLDGNEQYATIEEVEELWIRMEDRDRLGRLMDSTLFIEQPINRGNALEQDISGAKIRPPVIIDESDADLGAFPKAALLGYRGVSSKTCKGVYKSIINAARCTLWNREDEKREYFMSGEDLTTQPGVAVQQDLALVNLLGIEHLERNGHHYVRGMNGLPAGEQEAFLEAHPDLYLEDQGLTRVRIHGGKMKIGSLACTGYAVGAEPDWSSMQESSIGAFSGA